MSAKPDPTARLHVVLLWLPDALHGTLLSTLDALRTCAMFMHMQQPTAAPAFTWEILSPSGAKIKLPGTSSDKLCTSRRAKPDASRTLFVIPGLHAHNSPMIGQFLDDYGQALDQIQRHAAAGGWIAATYTGIALPAKIGLLDGARICIPWAHESWFQRSFTSCDGSDSSPIGRHGRVFTCVAPGLQTDFILAVLGTLGYADVAESGRQILLYQARRQELIPDLIKTKLTGKTSDSPVFRAMEWLNAHIDQPYSLTALAEAAATSERTVLRHFKQVAGVTPLEYLHEIRVERAKMLLQVTLQTVHTIAQACGYSDVASFRRVFRAATELTPTDYRSRFALRAKRRHWRVEAVA